MAVLFSLGTASAAGAQSGLPLAQAAPLPVGQTLPVSLERGFRAGDARPGETVVAWVTQRVPVSTTAYLPRGAEVLGTVVRSSAADVGHPAALVLQFNSVRWHGTVVPVQVRVLALASFSEVNSTYEPINGIADRGTDGPANWTTEQVGGDTLMRSGWVGSLESPSMRHVGFGDFHGIYTDPPAGDRGAGLPRALGPFSAEASGVYGYDPATTLGQTGQEIVVSAPGKLSLRRSDELLLQVVKP